MPLEDHPLRYALTNELHARPFPSLSVPGQAIYIAIKEPHQAAKRDRSRDREHLIALLDRFGAQHPKPGATHYFGDLGKFRLKWEQHTEFVTYTAFLDDGLKRPYDPTAWEVFPDDWLAEAPGKRITSAHLLYREIPEDDAEVERLMHEWFVPESLAVSRVLDDTAVIGGDFRIDVAGHLRFAVFTRADTGRRRLGRIVQRICEIETYKTVSMLALPRARELSGKLGGVDERLSHLVSDMTGHLAEPDETLDELLTIASELEKLQTENSFRFSATGAYEAIVNQRVRVLREERFRGRQTFAEFMMRRFDPAMRTVKATEARLETMSTRAIRAGELLRTRVDVDRSAQNQDLLASMDRRSDMQLRLQKTVEGLSVVAISYYAVSLLGYLIKPLAEPLALSETVLTAITVLPTVLLVWLIVRSIRRSVER
jgi:uncharacterized membrane-anchored protein